MIEHIDQRLREWIANLASPAEVMLASPGEMQGQKGVSLYLLEVLSNPPARGVQRPPLSVLLRYLITSWMEDPQEEHRLLGTLMLAAMEESEFEVETDPVPWAAWQAFGVAPRPALLLKVPMKKERPEKPAPLVRGKMSVRFGAMRTLQGQVLGPGRVPLMAAKVTLPSLQMTTRTDYNGRFRFSAVPSKPPVAELQVNARGRQVTWPVPASAENEPLLIELNETQI